MAERAVERLRSWRPAPRLLGPALGVAVLLGAALLFWAADRAVRWGAETLLARTVQTETGAAERPTVRVRGGFMLPQALRGRYDDVEVTADGLASGPLHVDLLHARLEGVYLPFSDVLTQRTEEVRVGIASERALLTYADLDHYLDLTGRQVRLDGDDDGIRLTGTVTVLGERVPATAFVTPTAEGGVVALRPGEVFTGAALGDAGRLLLRQRFTVRVPVDPLPFGRGVTAVRAGPAGVRVQARGTDVVIRP